MPAVYDIFDDYLTSRRGAIKPATVKIYERAMFAMDGLFRIPADEVDFQLAESALEGISGKSALYNQCVRFGRAAFSRAIKVGHTKINPFVLIDLKGSADYEDWSDEEVSRTLKCMRLIAEREPDYSLHWSDSPTYAITRRAIIAGYLVAMGAYTGQRFGDIVSLRSSAFHGMTVRFVQEKTGKAVAIPVHQEIINFLELSYTKLSAMHEDPISENEVKPFGLSIPLPGGPRNARTCIEFAKMVGGVDKTFHGLRKTCTRKLVESGCTDREVMAVTGHATTSMVSHYAKHADSQKLAENAFRRLGNG